MLVHLIELVDVNFVESVLRAELVDFVMDLVIDPSLVVIDSVVLNGLPGQLSAQTIHHFNAFEVNDDTSLSSAGDIAHGICLHGHLHCIISGHIGEFGLPARSCGR